MENESKKKGKEKKLKAYDNGKIKRECAPNFDLGVEKELDRKKKRKKKGKRCDCRWGGGGRGGGSCEGQPKTTRDKKTNPKKKKKRGKQIEMVGCGEKGNTSQSNHGATKPKNRNHRKRGTAFPEQIQFRKKRKEGGGKGDSRQL